MPDRFLSSEEYDERAHHLYNEGDYDGALETLKEGLALYPNAVELYVGLGYARLAREEFAWARPALERALMLDPVHEDAMVGMGEVLLRLGSRERALDLFRQVEAMGFEDDLELMLTMGRALYREGLYVQAHDLFLRLLSRRPDSSEAVASVGYAVYRMGDGVAACRHLRRALRMDPDLHEARIFLGHLLYDRGDWDGALREFERVPPTDHWDPLAVWRVLELKRMTSRIPEADERLRPWNERLDELEIPEDDPLELLLAEIEDRASFDSGWDFRDENQLELFGLPENEPWAPGLVHIRVPGGRTYRGTFHEVVRQYRDECGFSHEPIHLFMRRMAERWHEQYGVEVPATDPEAFVRGASACGLFRPVEEWDADSPPHPDGF
jgi:tetratricopeptide (TPR) repeat protein